ncbi:MULTISPECIES: hypothetical protein [unclassified Streptomyces]|uniref:hypothetical protein n=1 Tax=unclassified Streptomyces TaxID=2593676 RepID=UPI0022530002|nr:MULTISPECIES: hypothetical protein [unclassified Streptomyces]MCX4878825.1 hypothetical protein [Streptomyces sp. NBC_00847]MCX5418789.1 hypothetical protein [Streptomyces sp. NBC_00078]
MHQQVDHARQVLLAAALGRAAAHQLEVGAVEYSLTEDGKRLNDALRPPAAWGGERPTGRGLEETAGQSVARRAG